MGKKLNERVNIGEVAVEVGMYICVAVVLVAAGMLALRIPGALAQLLKMGS